MNNNEYEDESLGSQLISFFKQATRTFLETAKETISLGKEIAFAKIIDYFKQTKLGQKIEEAERKKAIGTVISQPIVIILIIVLAFLVFRGFTKR